MIATKERRQPVSLDRLPPQSVEAERGVLGCILISPDCIPACVEAFKKGGGDEFYSLPNRSIYESIIGLYDANSPIDLITLQQDLRGRKLLEGVGGLAYLASLPDATPSAANLPHYLEIVREKYVLRSLISLSTEVVARAYDHHGKLDVLLGEVEQELLHVLGDTTTKILTTKEAVKSAITTIEGWFETKGVSNGIGTGFHQMDYLTGGLKAGEMFIVAGRPSLGKTSLAMNMALNVAMRGIPVGVFSMEMSQQALIIRMLCSESRIDARRVSNGDLSAGDFESLGKAAHRICKAKIQIDDTPSLTMTQLRSKARVMSQVHGVKVFVIDYLQLLHGSGRRYDSRQSEVTEISQGVRALMKELGASGLVLAQLNREITNGGGRKPKMSDIRESGSIEQDADVIGMLYQPGDESEQEESASVIDVSLRLVKNRNGIRDIDVPLKFHRTLTRFETAPKIDPCDVQEVSK